MTSTDEVSALAELILRWCPPGDQSRAHAALRDLAGAQERAEKAEAEVQRLKRVIEADRSEVAAATTAIRQAMQARWWMVEGRGSYSYEDAAYRREFGWALVAIDNATRPLLRLAADWSDCPVALPEIQRARRARAALAERPEGTPE